MVVGPVTVTGEDGPVTLKRLNCLPEMELGIVEP
jgi:hypothetical protein